MKRWLMTGLVVLLLSGLQNVAGAESVTESVYTSVYKPKIALSFLTTDPAVISSQYQTELTTRVQLSVYQEQEAGWACTVQLSPITIEQQQGNETVQAVISSASVSFSIQNVTSGDAHTLPVGYSGTLSAGISQSVMQGEGGGYFNAEMLLNIVFPRSAQIVSVTGRDDLQAGQEIGLLAGEYRTRLISTLVSGI